MNIDKIKTKEFAPIRASYAKKDAILYALGLGFGADPLDEHELRYVFEKNLIAMPTMANVLCHPGFWAQDPDYGIDWVKILHAEQDLSISQPLAPEAVVRGEYHVIAIEDKGADKGALLHQEKTLFDDASNAKIATVRSTLFLRGNGGEGSFGDAPAKADPLPAGAPDRIVDIATRADQALIYRLSGDWNPIHADPALAQKAGFSKPILHGLCTNGIACRAILQTYCGFDAARFKSMFVRFSQPVYPGETVRFEFFEQGTQLRFRAVAIERDAVVLDRCTAGIG